MQGWKKNIHLEKMLSCIVLMSNVALYLKKNYFIENYPQS